MARWRDGAGRQQAKVFDRKRDAEAFEREMLRHKQLGDLDLVSAGQMTLADFAREQWWPRRAPRLARATRTLYARMWDVHVLPRLGSYRLRELRPQIIEDFRVDLEAAGAGPAAVGKAMALLQNVLERAVEWDYLPRNPAAHVRKPTQARRRAVQPPTLRQIEAIRAEFLAAGWRRDATLVSLLAYAGLRPGEALGLAWRHVREQTLLIERSNDDGELKATKTERIRTVPLLVPLARDLAELRLACGRPPADALLFPTSAGVAWRTSDYKNWRRRRFIPAAQAAGLPRPTPYDLRHGFASLRVAEGRSIYEIAHELGHKPSMTLDTYGHVLEELAGRRIDAVAEILAARQPAVSEEPAAAAAGA
jgi:integrase